MGAYRRVGLLGRLRDRDQRELTSVAERLEVGDPRRSRLRRAERRPAAARPRRAGAGRVADAAPARRADHRPRPPQPGDDPARHGGARERRADRRVLDAPPRRGASRRRVVLLAGRGVADGAPGDVLRPELLAAAFGGGCCGSTSRRCSSTTTATASTTAADRRRTVLGVWRALQRSVDTENRAANRGGGARGRRLLSGA
jgi:hypothetical protein